MEPLAALGSSHEDRLRSESADRAIKSEHAFSSPRLPVTDITSAPFEPSPTPLPSTETADPGVMPATSGHPAKRKATATAAKRGPKRSKPGPKKKSKAAKAGSTAADQDEEASGEDESDNGPYCVCRGPDDHRWMICCELCEDWFHGECININKEIGENLIERFICPSCTEDDVATIYKKTCGLSTCRKPARLAQIKTSAFCSDEHVQTWWERLVGRLPKAKGKSGTHGPLAQEELMALLSIGDTGTDGSWTLFKAPFSDVQMSGTDPAKDTALPEILSEEEKELLANKAKARQDLEEETLMCRKMLTLIELVQGRRRAAIKAGLFGEDICGYDTRLDSVSARDVFATWAKSHEGEEVLDKGRLGDPLGEDDPVRGMCDRKRCKPHAGWQKLFSLDVKNRIRENAQESSGLKREEDVIREAANERWRRKQTEHNWVEVIEH
ncbi:Set1 complex component spp1 [Moelleriella libera RCEF 2490]|uniref:Set1 complex component spp1 n=1 Tax=Moelleriella libera RCEF 2490 TaxID=1081109 RepID=A0A168EMF2_9HYPO|nr:Set1 complex component spp1 [Moelleriella libera RCEF 2490]